MDHEKRSRDQEEVRAPERLRVWLVLATLVSKTMIRIIALLVNAK